MTKGSSTASAGWFARVRKPAFPAARPLDGTDPKRCVLNSSFGIRHSFVIGYFVIRHLPRVFRHSSLFCHYLPLLSLHPALGIRPLLSDSGSPRFAGFFCPTNDEPERSLMLRKWIVQAWVGVATTWCGCAMCQNCDDVPPVLGSYSESGPHISAGSASAVTATEDAGPFRTASSAFSDGE